MELIRVQDSDYRKTYDLYMTFPENENGYMNNVYGYDYENAQKSKYDDNTTDKLKSRVT